MIADQEQARQWKETGLIWVHHARIARAYENPYAHWLAWKNAASCFRLARTYHDGIPPETDAAAVYGDMTMRWVFPTQDTV